MTLPAAGDSQGEERSPILCSGGDREDCCCDEPPPPVRRSASAATNHQAPQLAADACCASPPAVPYECTYCRRAVTACASEKEWIEHWSYVLQNTKKLAADIERLEDEMNKLTARKRMFQKLYMEQFSRPPPETPPRNTSAQWRGYIADMVRREMDLDRERQDQEAQLQESLWPGQTSKAGKPSSVPADPILAAANLKGKWNLKGMFSMSARGRPLAVDVGPVQVSDAALTTMTTPPRAPTAATARARGGPSLSLRETL